jgi:D-sedoheptulose 7-phosphate isomerase
MGLATMALLGRDGGRAAPLADAALVVPGTSAARIQETHAVVIHVLCALIEERIEGKTEGKTKEKTAAGP